MTDRHTRCEILQQHLKRALPLHCESLGRDHLRDIHIMQHIGIGGHLGITDDHAHPRKQDIGGRIALGQRIARSIATEKLVRIRNRGEIGLIDVALDPRDTILEQVDDQTLAIARAPGERAPTGADRGLGDGPIQPGEVRSNRAQVQRVEVYRTV